MREAKLGEPGSGHDLGGDLGDRDADRLGDEGHGARGARIDLEDVDVAVLHGVLHVHQPADIERPGERNVCRSISAMVAGESECGGSEQAESPEWMPASSMCSITPQTKTSLPSASASTSTSIASER